MSIVQMRTMKANDLAGSVSDIWERCSLSLYPFLVCTGILGGGGGYQKYEREEEREREEVVAHAEKRRRFCLR